MELSEDSRICDVDEVPRPGSLVFTYRDGFDTEEGIIVGVGGEQAPDDGTATDGGAPTDDATDDTDPAAHGLAAWKNYCQHWTDVRLDKGDGAAVRNGELLCQKHAALFRPDDGECTHGPCEGAVLDELAVAVHDGGVYFVDDRYEFDSRGPDENRDLSSGAAGGRIDFSGT